MKYLSTLLIIAFGLLTSPVYSAESNATSIQKVLIGTAVVAGAAGLALAYKNVPSVKTNVDNTAHVVVNKTIEGKNLAARKATESKLWLEKNPHAQLKIAQAAEMAKGALASLVLIKTTNKIKKNFDGIWNSYTYIDSAHQALLFAARAHTASKFLPYAKESFQLKHPTLIHEITPKIESKTAAFTKSALAGSVAFAAGLRVLHLIKKVGKKVFFNTLTGRLRSRNFEKVYELVNLSFAAYDCGRYSVSKLNTALKD